MVLYFSPYIAYIQNLSEVKQEGGGGGEGWTVNTCPHTLYKGGGGGGGGRGESLHNTTVVGGEEGGGYKG